MRIERFVIEPPEYPKVSTRTAERIIREVVKMTADAGVGLSRETLNDIHDKHRIPLNELEMYINRLLTVLYNTRMFTMLNKTTDPLSNVDVEVSRRVALVEITWNDRANKNHA